MLTVASAPDSERTLAFGRSLCSVSGSTPSSLVASWCGSLGACLPFFPFLSLWGRCHSRVRGQGAGGVFAHVNSRKPVKNIIGPLKDRTGSIISSDEGMANILNEYFTSGFTEEDTSEIPIVPIVYQGNNPLRKIEITVDKVKMKLKKLNSNKSAGPDGFYPRVIKETEEETAPHFCNIFRTSLEQRKAVRDWKLQNISPLFKKGSKDDPGNYRPISLTSVPGKMLESIIADDMMSHLEHNKLILDSHHGFRSGRSCLTNLVDFFHDMFSIYDKSSAVDILYLDFRKAFDKVPHKRLMAKVNPLGFHPYSARETPQLPGLSASGIFRAKTFFVVPYLRYL